ncbi:MAG: sigma 54-interacting transcriptional regulator [Bradymonadaceae bacterium]
MADATDIREWDAASFAGELDRDAETGRVVRLCGMHPAAIGSDLAELRDALDDRGLELLVLDPTGGRGDGATFREVVSEYVSRLEAAGAVDPQSERLLDFLSGAQSSGSDGAVEQRFVRDALCRLWQNLSRRRPGVLVVLDVRQCTGRDRQLLEEFASKFVADPVEELVPEVEGRDGVHGSLVFVGPDGDFPLDLRGVEPEVFDVSAAAREQVRSYLTEDDVVERFVASTRGDRQRLDALLETLPDGCANFWSYRYDDLPKRQRRIVDVLAVADRPLPLDVLQRAVDRLGEGTYFSRCVRELCDEGFLRRSVERGSVRLRLEDPEVGTAVAERLDDESRRRVHGAVAEAAEAGAGDDFGPSFFARHFLHAGLIEKGLEYGVRAARELHGRQAFERARGLLEMLLEHADETERIREIRSLLLEVCAGLGDLEEALEHLERLRESSDEEAQRLEVRRGELLRRSGDWEEAIELFRELQDDDLTVDEESFVELKAALGEGEALFYAGEHDEARERAREVVEAIDDEVEGGSAGRRQLDRSLLRARNLVGKVAVMRARHEVARPLFDKNRSLASRWGWEGEVARAEANLALVTSQQGDYDEAARVLEEVCERAPSPATVPRAKLLLNLGMCLQRNGELGAALERYREALRTAEQVDDRLTYGVTAYNLATLYQDLGAFDRAVGVVEHLDERQVEAREHLFVGPLPDILVANVEMHRRRDARALEVLADIPEEALNAGSSRPETMARLRAVQAHLRLGQIDPARRLMERVEVPEDVADRERLSALRQTAEATFAIERGEWVEAEELAGRAAQELDRAGYFDDALRASRVRVRALLEDDRREQARSVLERALVDLQERAETVPEAHRSEFYDIPLHRELVEETRQLDGDVPVVLDRPEPEETDETGTADAGEADGEAYRRWRRRYADIVGEDEQLLRVFRRIDQVADSDSPVLVQGESGTGKELVARAIHDQSERSEEGEQTPFIKVNCGAFVDNLLLSELFGHEKGAFTGAVEQKAGCFERADGGTIFLDEIGETSPKAQVALLRVLQEGEFERVGGAETHTTDVRVLCATNRDLEQMVERGEFRLDLYYRLKGVLLELPPLRERVDDIPRLIDYFSREFAGRASDEVFARDAMEFLASYNWPGNIRELKNFVRTALLFADGGTVEMEDLRELRDFFSEGEVDLQAPDIDYQARAPVPEPAESAPARRVTAVDDPEEAIVEEIVSDDRSLANLQDRLEQQSIRRALIETDGNITRAAEILDMTRPRLSQIVNGDDELNALKEQLVS